MAAHQVRECDQESVKEPERIEPTLLCSDDVAAPAVNEESPVSVSE